MRVAFFSTQTYDRTFFDRLNSSHGHELIWFDTHLNQKTAALAAGAEAVCVFVNDTLDASTLETLSALGVRFVALRCAGFNNVDLPAAAGLGMTVVRVPEYSPYAVAEHAVALILALNRRIPRAYNRVRDGNFKLDGLMGFDLHGKTVGVVGTGKIGAIFARIMLGFGCRVLAVDPYPDLTLKSDLEAAGSGYAELAQVFAESDVLSLHCPLNKHTHHLIDAAAFGTSKSTLMLVNTSRGALVDTTALIQALKQGRIGSVALDVYEEEAELFFADHSASLIQDDEFMRLLTFPNVLITAHQAFFTEEAVESIATITLQNMSDLQDRGKCSNEVVAS
ncbi:2-hydroxyacid dehydrogenase [Allohahella marinimesophila]|uniref:2-hydroxyacid dehydrogenase n=1 Tax=Allohahella marinimesophila TaxID=1054972 RepID=A0ABP7PXJ3_9GAMM